MHQLNIPVYIHDRSAKYQRKKDRTISAELYFVIKSIDRGFHACINSCIHLWLMYSFMGVCWSISQRTPSWSGHTLTPMNVFGMQEETNLCWHSENMQTAHRPRTPAQNLSLWGVCTKHGTSKIPHNIISLLIMFINMAA